MGFMLLYLRCLSLGGQEHWAAAATALAALAAAPSWGARPQMFTFTLASLLLWLLERSENRPRLLFWIPPLFLLWLNLHAGFALGPALLLAYGVGALLETAAGTTPWREARPLLLRVLLLLLACSLLVAFNPSGVQLYRYPFDTLRSHGMRSFIGEWRSPDFHQGLYGPFLIVWLLLLTVLASSQQRPKGRAIVPLLLTSFAALDAARHIPIFVLVAIPVIAAALPAGSWSSQWSPKTWPLTPWVPDTVRFRPRFHRTVVLLMAVFALTRWVSLTRNQDAREAELFPQKAIAFLRTGDYSPRVFVYYDWGGYAVWKLYPAYRVFVDGRADLYGDELLRQSMDTVLKLQTGWRDVLDTWDVETMLVPASSAVAQALLLDPNWDAAFSHSGAIVLLRRPAPNPAARKDQYWR